MKNAYKGYSLFNDCEDPAIRVWNRCAMAFNLAEDKGEAASQAYLECFDPLSKRQIYIMLNYIKLKGYEAVKREVFRGDHSPALEA